MALAVLDIVAGVAGIVSFGKEFLIPAKTSVTGGDSHVRFTIGLNQDSGENADGDAPWVTAFDDLYNFVGNNLDGHYIPNGGFSDLTIDQSKGNGGEPGAQPTYLQLQASSNNAVCIATIGQTWANGDTRGWIGDWGQICGWPWYYSDIHVDNHVPSCTWLDGDASYGNKAVGLQIYMQNFTDANVHPKDVHKDVYCKWPLQYYVDLSHLPDVHKTETSSGFWTNSADALWQSVHCLFRLPGCVHPSNQQHSKRSLEETLDAADPALVAETMALLDVNTNTKRPRAPSNRQHNHQTQHSQHHQHYHQAQHSKSPQALSIAGTTTKLNTRNPANRVISSTIGQHSASDLCASETSSGPDFVSYAESLYCDMDLKKTFPLCADEDQMGCYDVGSLRLRDGGALRRRDGGEGGDKVHDSLVEWK